jgi:hypothetical protein
MPAAMSKRLVSLSLLLTGCVANQQLEPSMPPMQAMPAENPQNPSFTLSFGDSSDLGSLATRGDQGAFDRNYLGGGRVMRITSKDGRTGILTIFQSEFHWGPTCAGAPCFYGTLGMGLSTDDGKSTQYQGQIIQPSPDRDSWINLAASAPQSLSLGDGPFVLGDINALAVDPHGVEPTRTYIYVFYSDYTIVNGSATAGLAVARALVADVIEAAFGGDRAAFPALFHKYYNPDGTLAARDAFTEPGVSSDSSNDERSSGRFTPVLDKAFSPSALYDATAGQVILASTTINKGIIELRTSRNLVGWGSPAATIDEGMEVRAPSLIGDQPDPAAGGVAPYLFYSRGPWPTTTLAVRRLAITQS